MKKACHIVILLKDPPSFTVESASMEQAQNSQNDQKNWSDLRDVSNITGLSIDALRKRIKLGKCEGRKVRTVRGYKWQINIDNIDLSEEVDTGLIKQNSQKILSSERHSDINSDLISEILKEELITAKDRHISDLQNVLTIFQQRITVLESDRAILENRLKLLPAPPEVISEKIRELESIRDQSENIRQELVKAEEERIRAENEQKNAVAQLEKVRTDAETQMNEARRELEEAKLQMEQLKKSAESQKTSEVDYDTLNKIRQLETFNKKLQLNLDEKAKMLEHVNQKFGSIQQAVRKAEEEKDSLSAKLLQMEEIAGEKAALLESLQEARNASEKAQKELADVESEIALEVTRRNKLEAAGRKREEEIARLETEKEVLAKALETERNKSFLTRLKELFFS